MNVFDFDEWDEEEFSVPEDFIGNEKLYNFLNESKIINYYKEHIIKSGIKLNQFFYMYNEKHYFTYLVLYYAYDDEICRYWNNIDKKWKELLYD